MRECVHIEVEIRWNIVDYNNVIFTECLNLVFFVGWWSGFKGQTHPLIVLDAVNCYSMTFWFCDLGAKLVCGTYLQLKCFHVSLTSKEHWLASNKVQMFIGLFNSTRNLLFYANIFGDLYNLGIGIAIFYFSIIIFFRTFWSYLKT